MWTARVARSHLVPACLLARCSCPADASVFIGALIEARDAHTSKHARAHTRAHPHTRAPTHTRPIGQVNLARGWPHCKSMASASRTRRSLWRDCAVLNMRAASVPAICHTAPPPRAAHPTFKLAQRGGRVGPRRAAGTISSRSASGCWRGWQPAAVRLPGAATQPAHEQQQQLEEEEQGLPCCCRYRRPHAAWLRGQHHARCIWARTGASRRLRALPRGWGRCAARPALGAAADGGRHGRWWCARTAGALPGCMLACLHLGPRAPCPLVMLVYMQLPGALPAPPPPPPQLARARAAGMLRAPRS